MPDEPFLSVVLPNYNHAHYLPRAVASLLSQTRPADEIVIIDDASTDGSWALIQDLAARHPVIRAFRNEVNLGCVRTLNRGLALARGRYAHCFAADDMVAPTIYAESLDLLARHPTAGFCTALSVCIDRDDNLLGLHPSPYISDVPAFIPPAAGLKRFLAVDFWAMGNTCLFNRVALLAIGGFSPEMGPISDTFASMVLTLRHGACYIPKALGAARMLPTSFSATQCADVERYRGMASATIEQMRGRFADLFMPVLADVMEARVRWTIARLASRLTEDRGITVLSAFAAPSRIDRLIILGLANLGGSGRLALLLYCWARLRGIDWYPVRRRWSVARVRRDYDPAPLWSPLLARASSD